MLKAIDGFSKALSGFSRSNSIIVLSIFDLVFVLVFVFMLVLVEYVRL